MTYIFMADIVRACIVVAYIVMAYIVMAHIAMAYIAVGQRREHNPSGEGARRWSPDRREGQDSEKERDDRHNDLPRIKTFRRTSGWLGDT